MLHSSSQIRRRDAKKTLYKKGDCPVVSRWKSCSPGEHMRRSESLLSGLGRETPVVGGKQPAEVALSRLRNCPSPLFPAQSLTRREPLFRAFGCSREIAALPECRLLPATAHSGNSVAAKARLQPAAFLRRGGFSPQPREELSCLQLVFSPKAHLPARF